MDANKTVSILICIEVYTDWKLRLSKAALKPIPVPSPIFRPGALNG